jgi:hypothetical protein
MFTLNMVSVIVLSVAVIVGTALGGPDSYVRFGPGNEDFPLSVLSLDINTWPKWLGVVVVLVLLSLADVIISQTAMMALYNNIYNSAQVEVTDFSTPLQLQTYAQLMYGMNSIRYILSVKISITQIDLALITTIASQLMTIPVIREKIMEKFKRMAEEHEDDEVELHKLSAHPSTHHPVHDMHISYRR